LKILEVLKTAALFLIAAGLFAMSYVIYDVMGKHGRYAPVSYEDDQIVVMDTHTGRVWSVDQDQKETSTPKGINTVTAEIRTSPKKFSGRSDNRMER
jgi:hypothetical protein